MDLARVKKKFIAVLAPQRVIDAPLELEAYASDYTEESPRLPGLVVLPKTVEEIQSLMRIATEEHCSLTARVSGSNVGGLALPAEGGVVVDLRQMNRILEVNPVEMYALIEPGVTWEQLKAYLEEQHIPLRMGYPLSPPDTSIMANCLLDGLGNLSLRYGAMADWIGGLEAVLPTGQVIRTGAPAVSDFWFGRGPLPDLTGLFVCWQGTTGIVTKMAFQLWPKPNYQKRMFLLFYDRNVAFQALRDLARLPICDDVGGLSWPTGKMLFNVARPLARDPGEPEFFLYLDLTGQSEREMQLRLELLTKYLDELRATGHQIDPPLELSTLVRLNPQFAKFAEFPTRLEFLVDHPGGGLTWVGTYGPLSQMEKFADRGWAIMSRCSMPPLVVSRPMKGGHFGVMRFIATFNKRDEGERRAVREMNRELVEAGLALGFIPYKTPPWVVEQMHSRINPAFVELMGKIRCLLDPEGIMAPHCWPLKSS